MQRLKEMDVSIIEDRPGLGKDFDTVEEGDVVILPAFGASVPELRLLSERNVQVEPVSLTLHQRRCKASCLTVILAKHCWCCSRCTVYFRPRESLHFTPCLCKLTCV